MTLRRRLLLALGTLPLCLAAVGPAGAQQSSSRPAAPNEAAALTRTGARRTAIVAAVDRVKSAVVNIHSERTVAQSGGDLYPVPSAPNRVNGMGTGIVIDPRGYIVTNHHVVEDVSLLRTRLADGTTRNAVVVARNPEIDLAVLKIDAPYPLPVLPIGTAQDLMVGETVIAVGNAYGYEHTVSVGVVSAIKRDVTLNKDMAYKSLIQTDAAINPGNSGGPLINVHGELVGVNVAIRAGAQNIGFAIPVDQMIRTVAEMLKNRRRSFTFDGLVCRDVLDEDKDGLTRRVVIERVEPNSPAQAAGLKAGDVLRKLGDVVIHTSIDVERAFLDRKVGESLPAVVRRENQEKNVALALTGADRMVQPAGTLDLAWRRLGLQLAPVLPELVARVNGDLRGGLEVTGVNTEGVAARAGIRKGDILVGLHQYETVNLDNVTYVLNHPDLTNSNPISFYILRSGQIRRGQLNTVP